MNKFIVSIIITLFCLGTLPAQSNINPDISLIGTFNTYTNFIKDTPEYGKLYFERRIIT